MLRIIPNADGSYEIPAGNLFAPGTALTKPEIYGMGMRNPYRISIDQKTGFVYWGDVGPDASKDSVGLGPNGHDEVNQMRKPGFFGWPYFVGNNFPYYEYDFETKKSGPKF
ncbi:MAG: PQQ-dependent sugar dehydrogenase [Saprospiraceae bacterium]|nr:PQQ-dependent sugar dehydrogenase [Saprospiraceae bacterium]